MSVSYKIRDSEIVLSATFYRQKLATKKMYRPNKSMERNSKVDKSILKQSESPTGV